MFINYLSTVSFIQWYSWMWIIILKKLCNYANNHVLNELFIIFYHIILETAMNFHADLCSNLIMYSKCFMYLSTSNTCVRRCSTMISKIKGFSYARLGNIAYFFLYRHKISDRVIKFMIIIRRCVTYILQLCNFEKLFQYSQRFYYARKMYYLSRKS